MSNPLNIESQLKQVEIELALTDQGRRDWGMLMSFKDALIELAEARRIVDIFRNDSLCRGTGVYRRAFFGKGVSWPTPDSNGLSETLSEVQAAQRADNLHCVDPAAYGACEAEHLAYEPHPLYPEREYR